MNIRKRLENIIFVRNQRWTNNKSGIILIVVLWILVILTLLSVSLGHKSSLEFALTKNSIGKLKSNYLAWAGLVYAIQQIKLDSDDEESSKFDTLYQCGTRLNENLPEDIFKKVALKEGDFDISYRPEQSSSDDKYFGMLDEERRININALSQQNYKVLSQLIVLLGFEESIGDVIAASIIDWKDEDSAVTLDTVGAEDDFYMGLSQPYHCKNRPFDSPEELLLVNGMSPQIFEELQRYITIYPKEGNLLVNFNTAPGIVLSALAKSQPNANPGDAESLVTKIITYRNGEDGQEFTNDDRPIDANDMALNAAERTIFLNMNQFKTDISKYLRVKVQGVSRAPQVSSQLEAIVYRDDSSITYWQRN